jgi:hypothetical protein
MPCEAEISRDSDEYTQAVASCSEATALVVDKDAVEQVKLAADQIKFLKLVARSKIETSALSSITEIVLHLAYQNTLSAWGTPPYHSSSHRSKPKATIPISGFGRCNPLLVQIRFRRKTREITEQWLRPG